LQDLSDNTNYFTVLRCFVLYYKSIYYPYFYTIQTNEFCNE